MSEVLVSPSENASTFKINHFNSGSVYLAKRRATTSIPLSDKFVRKIGIF